MTPEQVSALSGLELNRAMIWLYPVFGEVADYADGLYLWKTGASRIKVDYLEDYNLTMPLAFSAGVNVHRIFNSSNRFRAYESNARFRAVNENPLRAICECLVLIALGKRDG